MLYRNESPSPLQSRPSNGLPTDLTSCADATAAQVQVLPVVLAPMPPRRCFATIEIIARVTDKDSDYQDCALQQQGHLHLEGELIFNDESQTVSRDGKTVWLSGVPYPVFKHIWKNREQPSTHEHIAKEVWPTGPVKPKRAADETYRIRRRVKVIGIWLFNKKKRVHVKLL